MAAKAARDAVVAAEAATKAAAEAAEMEAKRVGVYDRTKYGMSPAPLPRTMAVWVPMYATPTPVSDEEDDDDRSYFGRESDDSYPEEVGW